MNHNPKRPPSRSSTAGVSSFLGLVRGDFAFHGATVTRKSRHVNEEVSRASLVVGLAQLARFAVYIHRERFARSNSKPGHLQVAHARIREVLAALHAKNELREFAARHALDDADIEQAIAYAR